METLFTLETPRLRLTWSGPRSAQSGAEPLRAEALAAEAVRIDGASITEAPVWLVEETSYPVLVQSLDGSPVALEHRDPVVVSGLVSADAGRVLHGRVRFGSQSGRSGFVVRAGSIAEVAFGVSVLPSKMTEAEVGEMQAEVEAAAAGLAVAAVRPASLADAGGPAPPSAPVWLAALRGSVDDLESAVRAIDRRPVLETARAITGVRPDRIRRPSGETRRAVQRSGMEAPVLPARPARLTADTPAHRWLATQLVALGARLRRLAREEASRSPSARRLVLRGEVEELIVRVERLGSAPLLADVGARAPVVPPLVLRRRPAYAAAYDALRRLDRGLALRAGGLDVATQDLAVLYETWAALAIVRSVAAALGVDAPARPFGVDVRGADVRLRRGRAHAVRLERTGVSVEVAYNPRFPAPPALLAQRPDLLLTVRRGRDVQRIVLDAKYRRDDSEGYRRRHGAAGPPEEALGTLHRYRDAIPGAIAVAAALYPGLVGDDIYMSRLWSSLGALGVGAIPLRPGATEALDRFIGRVVG